MDVERDRGLHWGVRPAVMVAVESKVVCNDALSWAYGPLGRHVVCRVCARRRIAKSSIIFHPLPLQVGGIYSAFTGHPSW